MVTKTIDFGEGVAGESLILQFENKMKFLADLAEISEKSPRELESTGSQLSYRQRFQDEVDCISARI